MGLLFTLPFSEDNLKLNELAKEYHERTEEYDRGICTGIIRDGCIVPANSHEYYLINRNARNILKEIQLRSDALGISRKDLQEAIANYRHRI